jgi:hypothetical protein
LIGVVSALVGPAEMHVFYLFADGGQFHYEGAGFASLMFANIAIQIAGYYVIAGLCIPLGYGHLKLRWWAPAIMKTLLVDWLIVGLPLSLMALLILVTSKGVTSVTLPFVVLGFILLYPVLPIMLLRFYRSPSAQRAFQTAEVPSNWLSGTPEAVKVAVSLLVLLAVVLHFPLLFDGFFPVFGHAVLGLPGTVLVDLSIATTVILVWGISQRYYWSWWCAVVFLGLLTASCAATFLTITPHDIVAQLPLAPLEKGALSGIPMRGYHLALFVGVIPTATLVAVVVSRRSFIGRGGDSRAA